MNQKVQPFQQWSDEALMLRVQKKEREAFSVLYDRYAREMVNFFYRRLGQDEAKSQDFLHDLFLKLLSDPFKYKPGKSFRPWLYSMAINMCKNEYRSIKVREEYWQGNFPHEIPAMMEVMERIDRLQFEKALNNKLNHLSEAHREVFLLRFQHDFSLAEIAALMECPEGTVKSRLFYTLKILSAELREFDPKNN